MNSWLFEFGLVAIVYLFFGNLGMIVLSLLLFLIGLLGMALMLDLGWPGVLSAVSITALFTITVWINIGQNATQNLPDLDEEQ